MNKLSKKDEDQLHMLREKLIAVKSEHDVLAEYVDLTVEVTLNWLPEPIEPTVKP